MLPLILNNLCFFFFDTVYSIFYGQMSKVEVAAQAIMLPVQSFAIGLFSGMAVATSIILGNKLGKDEIDGAISDSKVILRFAVDGLSALFQNRRRAASAFRRLFLASMCFI